VDGPNDDEGSRDEIQELTHEKKFARELKFTSPDTGRPLQCLKNTPHQVDVVSQRNAASAKVCKSDLSGDFS